MKLFSWLLFIWTVFFTYSILADCPPGDPNNKTIQKTYKEIREIYKNTDVLYIRLDKDEKEKIKKMLDKDNSLEIYLK